MQTDDDTVRDIAAEWANTDEPQVWRAAFSERSRTLIDAWLDGCITNDELNMGVYFAELDAVTK